MQYNIKLYDFYYLVTKWKTSIGRCKKFVSRINRDFQSIVGSPVHFKRLGITIFWF